MSFLLASEGPAGSSPGEIITYCLNHALDHTLYGSFPFAITKLTVMLVIVGAVIVLGLLGLDTKSEVPSGFRRNSLEKLLLFIRDGLARPTIGHDGDRFVPFFCTLFLFIFIANLLGLVPIPVVGGTITSNPQVTGTLALIVFLVGTVCAIKAHGIGGFLGAFIPGGLPKALMPLMFVLEVIGHIIKHGVLMVRLFANMIAGHLVIAAFMGLIFIWKNWVYAALPIGLSLFLSFLELLVAFIQAYVFTLISVLAIGAVVHPEH